MVAGKLDAAGELESTSSSTELMDGSWHGDVDFPIANIISMAAMRAMPELGKIPVPDFSVITQTVNPLLRTRFHTARARLAQ
jgi:hypothetical protein